MMGSWVKFCIYRGVTLNKSFTVTSYKHIGPLPEAIISPKLWFFPRLLPVMLHSRPVTHLYGHTHPHTTHSTHTTHTHRPCTLCILIFCSPGKMLHRTQWCNESDTVHRKRQISFYIMHNYLHMKPLYTVWPSSQYDTAHKNTDTTLK